MLPPQNGNQCENMIPYVNVSFTLKYFRIYYFAYQYLLFSISCIPSYTTNNILSFKKADLMSDHMTPPKCLKLYKTCNKYLINTCDDEQIPIP